VAVAAAWRSPCSVVAVMLAGGSQLEAAEKAHIQPTLASRLFLIWRCVTDNERPEAWVMGADPA